MYKQYRPYQYLLVFLDAATVVAALVTIGRLRPFLPGRNVMPTDLTIIGGDLWLLALLASCVYIVVFAMTGVYQLSGLPFFSVQMSRLSSAYLPAMLVFAGLLYFSHRDTSRLLVVYFGVTTYWGLAFARYAVHLYLKRHTTLSLYQRIGGRVYGQQCGSGSKTADTVPFRLQPGGIRRHGRQL